MKYKKFAPVLRAVIFITVLLSINAALNFAFIRRGLARLIINDSTSSSYECVFYGQSHSSYGINPKIVQTSTGYTTMNMSVGGQYYLDMYYYMLDMYKHYTPEYIILDTDYQYFVNIPYNQNNVLSNLMYSSYTNDSYKIPYFLESMLHKEYRAVAFPWMIYKNDYQKIPKTVATKLSSAYRNFELSSVTSIAAADEYHSQGFIYRRHIASANNRKAPFTMSWDASQVDYEHSVQYLERIIELCRSHDTKVIMITSPININTLIKNKDTYNRINTYIRSLARELNVDYYDFNLVRKEILLRSEYDCWDQEGHMYGYFADTYSTALGNFLNRVFIGSSFSKSTYFYNNVYEVESAYAAQ